MTNATHPKVTLLHLDAAANRSRESITRRLSALFAERWRATHAATAYRYRDLVRNPVAPIDTAYCQLGRRAERRGLVPLADVAELAETPAERREWALTHPLVAELLTADTVVIGAPMYNYSVPAALKAWIDRVTFPGAFRDPATGQSRLRQTRVVVITARGGAYGPGSARAGMDFQMPYLRAYLIDYGVRDENLSFVNAELTLAGLAPHLDHARPLAAESLAAAQAEVIALSATSGMLASGPR